MGWTNGSTYPLRRYVDPTFIQVYTSNIARLLRCFKTPQEWPHWAVVKASDVNVPKQSRVSRQGNQPSALDRATVPGPNPRTPDAPRRSRGITRHRFQWRHPLNRQLATNIQHKHVAHSDDYTNTPKTPQ